MSVMREVTPQLNMLSKTLTIQLLGGFHVRVGDHAVPPAAWRLRKAGHLVKLLALTPGHTLHREQLCDLLWPDVALEAAYNNLRYAIHVARQALDVTTSQGTLLPLRQQMLTLHPAGPLVVDVMDFEAAASRPSRDPAALHAALERYMGDLLPEDRYEEWAVARRESLRATYHALNIACAQLHEEREEFALAIPLLQRVVADDPIHEDAQVALMRLYARSGQRATALTQYAHLRASLRRELDAAPVATSQQLYADILAGQFAEALPPAVATPQQNLPEPLTRFIGRERERAEVGQLFATHRLVTLTGIGGCGKTRLALSVAAEQATRCHDGVWLIELAALVEPARVPQAVAATLGVREQPGQSLTQSLIDALRHKNVLLVLDNCEHLIAACSDMAAALLAACPRVRLLATSREALRVPGEVIWCVPSLTLPTANATPTQLGGSEAAELFIDRLRWRQPDFALTDDTALAIAAICRRLDGLPLAIELAAARTSVLSVTQLVARLDDALRILTGGSRTSIPRQQTLRATLDWSYDLLDEPERMLLERLAVFVGGCDLAAVEAICADAMVACADILIVLAQLVDKSLVVVEVQSNAARYHLLEVVRQYACERLQARGTDASITQRHADHYLALAEAAGQALLGAAQATWLTRLETEHDNLRATLRHARDERNVAQGLRLVRDLWRFWYARGYLSEGNVWLTQFLALGREQPDAFRRAALWIDALFGAGRVAYFQGNYAAARALFVEIHVAAEEIGDVVRLAGALTQLGTIALYEGNIADASRLYAEGLALRRTSGDMHTVGTSLGNLGWVALLQSDYRAAHDLFTECLALHREAGDKIEIARTLTGLGLVATGQRYDTLAHDLFMECLTLCQELNAKRAIADCLDGLAALATAQGNYARALRLAGAADALEAMIGNPLPPIWQTRRAQALAPARHALGDAASAEMLLAGRTMPLAQAIAEAQDNTATNY